MSLKQTNQMINELTNRLFIVEGEVTDLLTHETMQNLNANIQSSTGTVAIGSALAGQIGNAALANFAASDEGIGVSDFALEITDQNNEKHYFTGCFPVVVFKKGDKVKVFAEPLSGHTQYMDAVAMIDLQKKYMWTGQEVVKGRFRYRIFAMKLMGGVGGGALLFGIIIVSLMGGFNMLLEDYMIFTIFIIFIMFIFIGWRVGASFDGQSIGLAAILKKIGFNKPSRMDLQDFALTDLSWKNKEKDFEHERWMDYTYRIDLAQKEDAEKYGKNDIKSRSNH